MYYAWWGIEYIQGHRYLNCPSVIFEDFRPCGVAVSPQGSDATEQRVREEVQERINTAMAAHLKKRVYEEFSKVSQVNM